MRKILLLFVFGVFTFGGAAARTACGQAAGLLVERSKFKLLAANVVYEGEKCSPSGENDLIYKNRSEAVRVGEDFYYQGHRFWSLLHGDGLVRENFAARECRVFPLSRLAAAAGWDKHGKSENKVPDTTRGLFRVGDSLWMGSNGIGVAVYDAARGRWSRYDLKPEVIAGDHLSLDYADDEYVFVTRGEFPGTMLNVYSVKLDKWLKIKAVATRSFRQFGYSTGTVQVPVDHRVYAKTDYVPIDWTFMGLRGAPAANGAAYRFAVAFSDNLTVFEIAKSELDAAFRRSR